MNLFKGLIAGALAGAAASWVMERFQEQWLLREGDAGETVHYVTGAGIGGIYGLLAELAPGPTFGLGAGYGVAVALGVDEALVPALGLSRPAREVPASQHAYNLASHLVYSLTLEGARRVVRALL